MITYPIALPNGSIVNVTLSPGIEGSRTVKITIPKKASLVVPWTGEVHWQDINLDELILSEDMFSNDVLMKIKGGNE